MSTLPQSGYFVGINGQSSGPHTREALAQLLASGQLNGESLYWYEGLASWVRLGDSPLLAELHQAALPAAPKTDDESDKVFGALIKESWRYYHAHAAAGVIDDVFIGLIIAGTLDNGWSLIDLNSDGSNHYLRFENFKDQSRVYYQVRHLTPTVESAKTLGNRVGIVVGYGERTNDFGRIWSAIKQEYRSGLLASAEPGTITFDADMNTGYIYVQVDMFWRIDDYVLDGFKTDPKRLDRDLDATMHSLRRYLRGRCGK